MSLDEICISDILKQVELCKSFHEKCLKRFEQIFNNVDQNEFLRCIFGHLRENVFNFKNEYSERIIDFIANFVVLITSKRGFENPDNPDISFLRSVVDLILETLRSSPGNFRFNSCLLLKLILSYIAEENLSFEDDLFYQILDALLTRVDDKEQSVQVQALQALARLQEPSNSNCPVFRLYCNLAANDKSAVIRTEAVKMIARTSASISVIGAKTRDVNINVQIIAFKRCTDIPPRMFTIKDRQLILLSGLSCDVNVKEVFNNLLVAWLNYFGNDFINFLNALKLDGIEEDFINWENLCTGVFEIIFKHVPVQDIINALPLQDKLIPLDKMGELKVETILFWLLTIKCLKASNLLDDWDHVLPDLAPFCDYIENITQLKNQHMAEEWKMFEYTQIVYQLLEIIELCDVSEQFGRQKLHTFVLSQIKQEAGSIRILKKLIALLSKLIPQSKALIDAAKGIISELHVMYVRSEEVIPVDNVEAEIIRHRITATKMDLDDALKAGDYLKAEEFERKRNEAEGKLKQLNVVETIVVTKAERNAIACNILNVFIAFMESPMIDTLTGTLQNIYNLAIQPLSDNYDHEVRWRFLRAMGSMCVIDEAMAKKNANILMGSLCTYYNGDQKKRTLIVSIEVISDLFLCYNTQLFFVESDGSNPQNVTKRKLYSNKDGDIETTGITKVYFEGAIHVIMDLIDDENIAVSKSALTAIYKMIRNKLPITSQYFSRLLLNRYNPTTDLSIGQLLSRIISDYLNHVKGGKEVMINSLLSVLQQITSAGMESPLAKIDVENLLEFVAVVTESDDQIKNHHLSIAEMVLTEIQKRTGNGLYIKYLIKILVYLKLPNKDASIIRQVLSQVNSLLDKAGLTESEVTDLNTFKKAIMSDKVSNDEVDDTNVDLGKNETPKNNRNRVGTKSELQALTSNFDLSEKGCNEALQSCQSSSSNKDCKNHGNKNDQRSKKSIKRTRKNGQAIQKSSSEDISGTELASQNKISICQSSQNSSSNNYSCNSQSKNHDNKSSQTTQTSLSTNLSVSDLNSQSKKTTSQSTQNSSGSDRITRSKTGNHGKNNGQTIQTSLRPNVLDLGSQNNATSQSTPNWATNSSGLRRSPRTPKPRILF